jgi:hypothetical protein
MYAVIRKYTFDPKSSQEIKSKIQDVFVPLVKKTPGFISYCWMDTGSGTGASIGTYQNKAGAEASDRLAAEFASANLAHLHISKPEITEGEVTVSC